LSENLPGCAYSDQREGNSFMRSEERARRIPAEETLQPELQASGKNKNQYQNIYYAPHHRARQHPLRVQRIRYNGRANGNMQRNWFPYAIDAAVAVAIAGGLWFYNWWFTSCGTAIGGC
jgi:hypothetical protein